MTIRNYIVIHHTAAEEKNARQVKQYHLSKGWKDVGYNYIIEKEGVVVPGRSLEIPGAHTKADGMNYKSIGITLIGNLELRRPTEQQLISLLDLTVKLQRTYDIPKENVLLHREVAGANTLCPGKFFPTKELSLQLIEPTKIWRVQVGAFTTKTRAADYATRLRHIGIDAFVIEK